MWKFILGLIVASVLTLSIVSVVQGWLPNHADAAFLCTAGFDIAVLVLWLFVSPYFGRTNGNDTGLIAFGLVVAIALVAMIAAPVAVFIGASWWAGALIGAGVALIGACGGTLMIRS